MKMWSRGLGRTELFMDLVTCQVKPDRETGAIIIYGNVKEPVNWEFKGTIYPEDIAGIMKLILNISVLKLVLRNLRRYFVYAWKSRSLKNKDEVLEDKVNSAYDQIMRRGRPGLQV